MNMTPVFGADNNNFKYSGPLIHLHRFTTRPATLRKPLPMTWKTSRDMIRSIILPRATDEQVDCP